MSVLMLQTPKLATTASPESSWFVTDGAKAAPAAPPTQLRCSGTLRAVQVLPLHPLLNFTCGHQDVTSTIPASAIAGKAFPRMKPDVLLKSYSN